MENLSGNSCTCGMNIASYMKWKCTVALRVNFCKLTKLIGRDVIYGRDSFYHK